MTVSVRTQINGTHWVNDIRVAKTRSGLITLAIDFKYPPSYEATVFEHSQGTTQEGVSFTWEENGVASWIELYIDNEPNIRHCGSVWCKKQLEVFFAPWSEFEELEYSPVSLSN